MDEPFTKMDEPFTKIGEAFIEVGDNFTKTVAKLDRLCAAWDAAFLRDVRRYQRARRDAEVVATLLPDGSLGVRIKMPKGIFVHATFSSPMLLDPTCVLVLMDCELSLEASGQSVQVKRQLMFVSRVAMDTPMALDPALFASSFKMATDAVSDPENVDVTFTWDKSCRWRLGSDVGCVSGKNIDCAYRKARVRPFSIASVTGTNLSPNKRGLHCLSMLLTDPSDRPA
jgi:hypothetical protein